MFYGESVNVARYDQAKYPEFLKLIEKQLGFFWRPEEVDVSKDRIDFQQRMTDDEQYIFSANLRYQTLLDSVQGRAVNLALLPVVSIPELETWIETWSFSETIHSASYTHIIRNVYNDPGEVFDGIVLDSKIMERAEAVTKVYDEQIQYCAQYQLNPDLIENDDWRRGAKRALYLAMNAINILEAIRFYVSFVCSWSFAERELLEGNGKIIKLIARDESLHMQGTIKMINIMQKSDDDPEMAEIAMENIMEVRDMFYVAAMQEIDWAKHLFDGRTMMGLNAEVLIQYIKYLTNQRARQVNLHRHGLGDIFDDAPTSNPVPWISSWTESDNVQVAPQEAEISSYLVGAIDSTMVEGQFEDFEL